MKKLPAILALLVASQLAGAQSPETLKIRAYRAQHEGDILHEFVSLLTIPNVASDTLNIKKSADFIARMMKQRGIKNVQLWDPLESTCRHASLSIL